MQQIAALNFHDTLAQKVKDAPGHRDEQQGDRRQGKYGFFKEQRKVKAAPTVPSVGTEGVVDTSARRSHHGFCFTTDLMMKLQKHHIQRRALDAPGYKGALFFFCLSNATS